MPASVGEPHALLQRKSEPRACPPCHSTAIYRSGSPRFKSRIMRALSARIDRCSRSVRQSGQITPTISPCFMTGSQ